MSGNITNLKGGKNVDSKREKKARQLARKKARVDKEGYVTPTKFVKKVEDFEKKHRRLCTIDDIANLYENLQIEDMEPHEFSCLKEVLSGDFTSVGNANFEKKVTRSNCKDYYGYYVDAHNHLVWTGYWVGVNWDNLDLLIFNYDCENLPGYPFEQDSVLEEKTFYPKRRVLEPHSFESNESGEEPWWVTRDVYGDIIDVHDELRGKMDEKSKAPNTKILTGVDPTEFMTKTLDSVNKMLGELKGIKLPGSEIYFSVFEDIASIIILIQQKASWLSISVLCTNIVKRYLGSSLIGASLDVFHYLTAPVLEPQDFMEHLNKVRTAPAFFRTQIFKQIRKLIVGMISFGLIDPVKVSVSGIKLLDFKAEEISNNALDLVDYVLDLFTYFIKVGHMVFHGDFSFLSSIDEIDEIDTNIIHLKSNIERVANGGYTKDTSKTVGEYQHLLYQTHEQVRVMSRRCDNATVKKTLLSKLDELTRLMIRFEQINPLQGLRKAPFSVSLYGLSEVGKSTVADIILKSVLKSNGFSADDEQICTLQPNDKFYSTWKQNTVGVLLDDVSNTLATKATVNPADMIISLVNNVKYSAPKADTKDKGIFNVEPHVVVATTNCKDLGASQWSVEPFSVVRRLKYHITVTVKQPFQTNGKLASGKIDDKNNRMWKEYGVMDVWEFKVEVAKALPRSESDGVERYNFEVVRDEHGLPLNKLDIFELQSFLNKSSAEFYAQQEIVVSGSANSAERMAFCKVCKYQDFRCVCDCTKVDPVEENIEIMFEDQLEKVQPEDPILFVANETEAPYSLQKKLMQLPSYINFRARLDARKNRPKEESLDNDDNSIMENQDSVTNKIVGVITNKIYNDQLLNVNRYLPALMPEYMDTLILEDVFYELHWRTKWLYNIPNMDPSDVYELTLQYPNLDYRAQAVRTWSLFIVGCISLMIFSPLLVTKYCLLYIWFALVISWLVTKSSAITFAKAFKHWQERPMKESLLERCKSKYITPILIGGVSLATLGSIVAIVKICKRSLEPHGNLCPVNEEDYESRDQEKNVWKNKMYTHETNPLTVTMSASDLLNKVSKNCFHFVMETEHTVKKVACIAICPKIVMFPMHFFHKESNITKNRIDKSMFQGKIYSDIIKGTMIRKNGGTFTATITPSDIIRIGDADLCLVHIANTGDMSDITHYVVENWTYNGPGFMGYRNPAGEWVSCSVNCVKTSFVYSPDGGRCKIPVNGGKTTMSIESQKGMCTAPIICDSGGPSIVGFHIAGFTNTTSGAYNTITRSELISAKHKLVDKTGILEGHCASNFKTVRYGVDVNYSPTLSSKAPVNWIDDGDFIVRGDIDKQYSYWTQIRRTIMCPIFEELTGTTCPYAGPQFGPETHKPFSTHLAVAATPGHCFNTQLLLRAKEDYIYTMYSVADNYVKHNRKYCRPLEQSEIINGIHGVRFIDAMNMNASFGFPKGKKKRHYLVGDPGHYIFKNQDEIDRELEDMYSRYINNERYYPIFRACLKDEPQKRDKFKVRVFHACDMALQFALRKYYLPIARIFHMHPIESECAVGLNPQSNEWHQMHDYITFGGSCDNRIVAGDYSKWDIRLPPDVVYMAFKILIDIAEQMPHYTPGDIKIMKGLATDVTLFSCHFNGTLIEFNSGVPSGHNLTALLNSICNSLLQRCGYFSSGGTGHFRSNVHTSTYGDDFWSGVQPRCSTYNHLTYRDFLKDYDIVLTMPNKTDEATPFLDVWDCDFLKRRSVLCPYDNIIYGALDVTSINKSLMVKGKTSTSNRRHAYDVLFSAMRELSYHDLDTYEYWSGIYSQIAEELKILFPGRGLLHAEYYEYRNEESKPIFNGGSSLTDYPMALEAFDGILISNLEDKSTLDEVGSFELELLFEPEELANTNQEESYRGTIIHEDSDSLNSHMEPHAEVYGNEPAHQDAATLQSGVLHMAGAKEEAVIETELVSKDMLSLRQHESRSLSQYLSRPMQIAQYSLPVGQDYFYNPRPLRIFLGSKLIRDKIRHYAYLNGVLNIKVTSVGSPQITGAAHVALHPWWARDNGLKNMGLTNVVELTHCQMSQLPSFVVDFGAETGGHIRMPIIAPTNGLNISELDQIEDAFMLHIRGFVPLRVPPTSNVTASIQVYAWLEDVSLTGTTYRSELPAPQSDEFVKDPNNVGASTDVSFKSAISVAAGNVVGKATELGVSTMMSAMGLSSPLVPSGADPIVPRTSTNMACYNSQQNIDSLASDAKNQVELGTTELGYNDIDHMAMSNIYKRWGHIGRLVVDLTDSIGQDSDIKIIPVSPLLASFFVAGSDTAYSPTPLAIATLPFAKWRGGLEFKFHAIGSAFLKGKLRISHDVNTRIKIGNEVRDFKDTQTLNSVIWDMSQYRTMTIQVPWTSNLAFKDTGLLRPPFFTSGAYGQEETDFDSTNNGLLILEPITRCSDQNFTEAYILVSVRGMDGMAFGDLRAPLTNYTFSGINYGQDPAVPEPQSAETPKLPVGIGIDEAGDYYIIFQTAENIAWFNDYLKTKKFMEPQSDFIYKKPDVTTFGGQVSQTEMVVNIAGLENNMEDHDKMAMACMGEKFFNIRQIIKRYTHNWTRMVPVTANGGVSLHRFRLPDRPLLKGWQGPTASLNIDPSNKPVTYARDSFLSFFSVCFLGYRGSFRHKVLLTTNDGTSRSNVITINRGPGGTFYEKIAYGNTNFNQSASAVLLSPDMRAGGTVAVNYQAPMIEYSTPFHCRAKYAWAQDRTPQNQKFTYDGGFDIPWHTITITAPEVAGKWFRVDKYIAAGDDFSLFFYLYAPIMLFKSPTGYPQ